MALLRKLFYRKPPDGLLEICDRVHVFDCCFTTDTWEEENYKVYIRGIVGQLRDYIPDASILVFNFHEGEGQSRVANFLSDFDMTVMDYPRHYEGCPLLTVEMINHFLRSSESWLSLGPNHLLLMHCERGGWPILAFMLAGLLIFRKHYTGEQKTLEMIYKQSPQELLQCLSPLNPIPSQLRYLQYISRRNMASEWPPLDRALTLDCVIIRLVPNFDGKGGCCPIFRLYGQDPLFITDRTPKLLFSTPQKSKTIRQYKQEECELVKIDINCHIQGDVVLECINLNDDLENKEMIFRVMFNTAFIRSNILMLNRDEVDILWNARDQFPKNFRAEVLFSDVDAAASVVKVDLSCFEEKDGLPVEAFAKVHEIFSHVDWLDPKTDAALNVLQQITASNVVQGRLETDSFGSVETSTSLQELIAERVKEKQKPASSENSAENFSSSAPDKHLLLQKPSEGAGVNERKAEPQLQDRKETAAMEKDTRTSTTFSIKNDSESSLEPSTYGDTSKKKPVSRYHSSSSATGIRPSFPEYVSLDPSQDVSDAHKSVEKKGVLISPPGPPPSPPIQPTLITSATKTLASPAPPPPPPELQQLPQLPPRQISASKPTHLILAKQSEKYLQGRNQSSLLPPLLSPGTPVSSTNFHKSSSDSTSPSPVFIVASSTLPPPPPSPLPLKENLSTRAVPSPPPPPPPHFGKTTSPRISSPVPPPPPTAAAFSSKFSPASTESSPPSAPSLSATSSKVPPPPPPPATSLEVPPPPPPAPAFSSKFNPALEDSSHAPSAPPPPPPRATKMDASGCPAPPAPCGFPAISNGRNTSCTINSRNHQTRKLKPLHWLKLTRAVSGSLWAETQKSGEASKAPEIDMSELESLFSAAAPKSDHGNSSGKSNSRAPAAAKVEKVQLIEHRRAYNCEIMLSKVKVPLHELMSSVLALEDSALDADQVDNLTKFCPTKDEMELLKGYKGEKEKLGKCEQCFLELMKVPRVETKLRVFSFKIQFPSQVSYLRTSLNVVNSAAEEIKSSVKLKRIMQTILQLGNALNQGTSRGAAIGFRLDSLLKLADTRARDTKITLMHYLCKVLADKLPEVLDFSKDLASLEPASKIQLKFLAEEMQAISKGLEKVMQELSSSENDGPISETFCKILKKFLHFAETEVRALASLYSGVGRNVDALILYFGEDPARCPFEQVMSTLLNFVRMFNQAHEKNCKQLELEKKKEGEGITK